MATDTKGNPKADAAYAVKFSLYSTTTSGSSVWNEAQQVSTSKGLFSTLLGAVTPIPDSLFDGRSLYLGVSFDGGTEGARTQLGITPWATRSSFASQADSARAARFADTAKVAQHLVGNDSMALRTARDSIKSLKDSLASLRELVSGKDGIFSMLQRYVLPSDFGVPWNISVDYGYLRDYRDGQVYRTVKIGNQTWMAQNLNYAATASILSDSSIDSTAKYGRMYSWATILGLNDSCNVKTCKTQIVAKMTGICPLGWHVPDTIEYGKIIHDTVYSGLDGRKLRAYPNADQFGFRLMIPKWSYAQYWTTSEGGWMYAYYLWCGSRSGPFFDNGGTAMPLPITNRTLKNERPAI